MSAFVLFVIILTCAYLLYYIALIALDVRAMAKGEEEKVERITLSGNQETADMESEAH